MWPMLPLVPKCQRAAVNSCGGGLFCITRRARPNCADTEAEHSRKIASSRASRFMEARLFHRRPAAILYKAVEQGAIPAPGGAGGLTGLRSTAGRGCSEHQQTNVGQQLAERGAEHATVDAVHGAMVIGQGEGQHGAWLELLAVPHRLHAGARHAEDGDLGGAHDGRESRATEVTQAGDGAAGAFHVLAAELDRQSTRL